MEIFFKRAKLARVLNSAALLAKEYGARNAQQIRCRLSVLHAVDSLADVPKLPPDRCHRLKGGELKGNFAVDVVHPFRIVFEPRQSVAKGVKARLSLHKITAITILEVVDYH